MLFSSNSERLSEWRGEAFRWIKWLEYSSERIALDENCR